MLGAGSAAFVPEECENEMKREIIDRSKMKKPQSSRTPWSGGLIP
jgi:hypothetical protein